MLVAVTRQRLLTRTASLRDGVDGVQDDWTALHHAASGGDAVAVRALLEAGASRAMKNSDGKSARQVAAMEEQEQVVSLFRQWTMFEGDSDEDTIPDRGGDS